MNAFEHVRGNVDRVTARIAAAAARVNREVASVTLVAVTKTYSIDAVKAVAECGVLDAGENRVQEALPKISELATGTEATNLRWHLIGHLQSNKARQAVASFDLIHSVDSVKLAQELNRHALSLDKLQRVLIQVNVSGEESKSGLPPGAVEEVVGSILSTCPAMMIEGFMTIAPLDQPGESARRHFVRLRQIRDEISNAIGRHDNFQPDHLSMGMTNDYEVAIEEGATLVRIGSAIFGTRD